MSALETDVFRSASHRAMAAHLSAPFTGGAVDSPVPLDAQGRATVDRLTRQPLLLVAPRADVGAAAFQLSATITAALEPPEPLSTVVVRFEPFTEAGAFLPLYLPVPSKSHPELAAGFTVALTLSGPGVPEGSVADAVELRLVEGTLGRLLYIMGAEKQRLRRQSHELLAARRLANASGNALDRFGADLGVPRFADRLTWDAAHQQPGSAAEREPDEAYRRRLGIYRPFLLPTRQRILERLNGRGGPGNTGPLGELGFAQRFLLEETNSGFAVAPLLVSSPGDTQRQEFLKLLRKVYLLSPKHAVPATRLIPTGVRSRQEALLARLRTHFTFPQGEDTAWMAPALASVLDRVGRCRDALGVTRPWAVLRAQDDQGGSRYELGLGLELEPLPEAELDTLAANARQRTFVQGTELEIVRLLESLTPVERGADPIGRWLLAGCGLRTVHRLPNGVWYLSHLLTSGLVLSQGPLTGGHEGSPRLPLEVRCHAPGEPGPNVLLVNGLRDVQVELAAQSLLPFTELSPADARAGWRLAVAASQPLANALTSAGLRVGTRDTDAQGAVLDLDGMPPELMATLRVDATLAQQLWAGQPAASEALRKVVDSLGRNELVSVLALPTEGQGLLLVVGAMEMPGVSTLLNARREGIRWFVLPIHGQPGALQQRSGPRNFYLPAAEPGLSVVVAMAIVRADQDDPRGRVLPYEVKVELPPGALLDLPQYEFLMNLLKRVMPMGVTFDTHAIREGHVAPARDGKAFPLSAQLSHGFRAFRQRRQPGERGVNPED